MTYLPSRKEVEELLPYLTKRECVEIDNLLATEVWNPNPGQQTAAYRSEAREVLFGGKPWGGKSDLLLGLAFTAHSNSLIFRHSLREIKRTLIPRSREIAGSRQNFNASDYVWSLPNRRIEFGYLDQASDIDRYKGGSYDLLGFDEGSELLREHVERLRAWNRTTNPKQRVRLVVATNPLGDGEEWIVDMWRPWLDETYPNPAQPGELRYFIRDEHNEEVETTKDNPKGISRTFIPSDYRQNPYADHENYEATLDFYPEPYRTAYREGRFGLGRETDTYQVCPSEWVKLAQNRWKPQDPERWDSVGMDVAHGGADKTVIVGRYKNWFSEPRIYPGRQTPDGDAAAQKLFLFLEERRAKSQRVQCIIDALGYGAKCATLARRFCNSYAYLGHEKSDRVDSDARIKYTNLRSEAWWRFRKALDPNGPDKIELPPSRSLFADLVAPRFKLRAGGLMIENKDDIKKRLGRSPDEGDAFTLAFFRQTSFRHIQETFDDEVQPYTAGLMEREF